MADILTFTDSSEAFREAKRRAVYGHRNWVVWRNDVAGSWHAARMTAVAVERAVAESASESKKFFGVGATDGICTNYGHNLARVLLSNLKNGYC